MDFHFANTLNVLKRKENSHMYDKVPTSMNFVEREKKVEKFWEENHIFEKSIDNRKKVRPTPSTTDRLRPTENHTSAM